MFIELMWQNPQLYFTWLVLVVFSICLHEMCHAWMAAFEGDSTAMDGGYLTLNPLRVMGPVSLIFAALAGFAWGGVPVNPRRFRHRFGPALVSFAGPGANLALAVVFGLLLGGICGFTELRDGQQGVLDLSAYMALIGLKVNLFLCLFNLLPIPILDGWEIARLVVPPLRQVAEAKARHIGLLALLVIFFARLHEYLWLAADAIAGVWLAIIAVVRSSV